jgi:hypothetical protein
MNPQSLSLSGALRTGLVGGVLIFACAVLPSSAWAGTTSIGLFDIKIISSDIDTAGGGLHIRIDGDVAFSPAEDDVLSLSKKAVVEERRGDHVYRIVFEHTQGGLSRTYTVDGKQHDWDAEGKRWLAGTIPTVLRETAFECEARSKRIYAAGGTSALEDEIDLIHSDYARRNYIAALAGMGKLDEKQALRVLAAAEKIHADFERRTAYVALIEHQTLGNAAQAQLLQGAAAIHSDFELRTVLVALAPKLGTDDAVAQAWLGAMYQLHSDFEARAAVTALVDAGGGPAKQVDLALQSTQNINAAFERRTALVEIARNMAHPSDAQVAAYAASASRINGDFERRNAIVDLADKAVLSKNGCLALLGAIDGMNSDFEIRNALLAIARQVPKDEDVISRYRHIARKLGDFERGQAEKALDRLG